MKASVKYLLLLNLLLAGLFSQAYVDVNKSQPCAPVAEQAVSPDFEFCDAIYTEIPASRPEKAVFKMDVAETEVEEEDLDSEKKLNSDDHSSALSVSALFLQRLSLGKISSLRSAHPYTASCRYLLLKVFRI